MSDTSTRQPEEAIPEEPAPILVTTSRGPVECAVAGEGPAVIALHGAKGGYDQGLILARTIAEAGYRFIAISRPGYLRTPLRTGRSPEEQADLYAEVLDALGVRGPAAVMAVSGGGYSALHFALRHRERCWGLVLVSTAGGIVEEPIPLSFRLTSVLVRFRWLNDRIRRKIDQDPRAAAGRAILDPAVRARTLADRRATELLVSLVRSTADRMAMRVPGTFNDIRVTRVTDYPLERVGVPVIVVHGTRDRMVPFERHGRVLGTRIPGAELLAIEGGEHVSIFTHRAEVRAKVTRFLREHAPKAAAGVSSPAAASARRS